MPDPVAPAGVPAPSAGIHRVIGPAGLTVLHYALLLGVYLLRSLFPGLPAILSPISTWAPTPPPAVAPAPAQAPSPAPAPPAKPPQISIPWPFPAPAPAPQPPAKPVPDKPSYNQVKAAIVWIGNCTATLLTSYYSPGETPVLTAAHCVSGIGAKIPIKLADGRRYTATVVAIDRSADCALAVIRTLEQLPYAALVREMPPKGTKVWHQGGGRDRPWNTEYGTIRTYPYYAGRVGYNISFSPGDSGSGIFTCSTNELVGTCHGSVGGISDGASAVQCRKMIAKWYEQRKEPKCPVCP